MPPLIKKMGYKGVESTELVYDGYVCAPTASSAVRRRPAKGSAR